MRQCINLPIINPKYQKSNYYFQLNFTLHMEPLSHTRKMRQQFSVAIRREKKEEIFQSYRTKLKSNLIEQQQHRMAQFLDTPQRKEEWLLRRARQLTGIPDASWRPIINELLWSLLCFKGKGSFRIWIETSIIKNLCSVFYEEYSNLGLCSLVAHLLSSIIYLEEQEEQQKVSYIAEEIFKQEILSNLILLAEDTALPHDEISYFMSLISNLAENEPSYVIRQGGFSVCVQWSIRMLKQKKLNRSYLQQIYNYLQMLSRKSKNIPANYNFANQTLGLLNEFIQIDQSVPLLVKILGIIQNVLHCKREAVYATFVNLRPLTKKIFELSTHDNENIREKCWTIFGYVTSGEYDVRGVFEQNHYIDAMLCAYQKQPKDNHNFDKITSQIINCIGNIACEEGDVARELILFSPLINIVIDSTHPERSTNLRKDAYYCLATLVQTKNTTLFNKIVFDLPILEKLVIGLQTMMKKNKGTVSDILLTLKSLIMHDNNVFRTQGQSLLEILESKFNFSNLLNEIMQTYHKNNIIAHTINEIFDLFSC